MGRPKIGYARFAIEPDAPVIIVLNDAIQEVLRRWPDVRLADITIQQEYIPELVSENVVILVHEPGT